MLTIREDGIALPDQMRGMSVAYVLHKRLEEKMMVARSATPCRLSNAIKFSHSINFRLLACIGKTTEQQASRTRLCAST